MILLSWFVAKQKTSIFTQQKSGSFYSKFSVDGNDLNPTSFEEQEVAQQMIKTKECLKKIDIRIS